MNRPLQWLACLLALTSLVLAQQSSDFKVVVAPVNGTKSSDKMKNKEYTDLEKYLKVDGHVGAFVDFDPSEGGYTLKNRIHLSRKTDLSGYTENAPVKVDMDANTAFVQTDKESIFIDFDLPLEKGIIRFNALAPKTFNSFGSGRGFGALGAEIQREGSAEKVTEIHLVAKIQDRWRASSYYSPLTNYTSMHFRLVFATENSTLIVCYGRTGSGQTESRVLEITSTQVNLVDEQFIASGQLTDRFESVLLEETKDGKLTRYLLAMTQDETVINATTTFTVYAFNADNTLNKLASQYRLFIAEDDTNFDRLACSRHEDSTMSFQCVYTDANQLTRVVVLTADSSKFAAKTDFLSEHSSFTINTLAKQGMRTLCQNPEVTNATHCSDSFTLGNLTLVRVENTNYKPDANKTGVLGEQYQAFVYAHAKNHSVFRTLGAKDLGMEPRTTLDNGIPAFLFSASHGSTDVMVGALSLLPNRSHLLRFESNGVGIDVIKQQNFGVHQQFAVRQLDGELSRFTLDQILIVEKSTPPDFDSNLIIYAAIGFLVLLAAMMIMYVFLNKLCGDFVTKKPDQDSDLTEKLTSGASIAVTSSVKEDSTLAKRM